MLETRKEFIKATGDDAAAASEIFPSLTQAAVVTVPLTQIHITNLKQWQFFNLIFVFLDSTSIPTKFELPG